MSYNVGDKVRIIPSPPQHGRNIPPGFIGNMIKYCGRTAVIESVRFSSYFEMYIYRIDLDSGEFAWCDRFFESEIIECPDLEFLESDLRKLFGLEESISVT